MALSSYQSVAEVIKEFQITYTEANFIVEAEFQIPSYFQECELEATNTNNKSD